MTNINFAKVLSDDASIRIQNYENSYILRVEMQIGAASMGSSLTLPS